MENLKEVTVKTTIEAPVEKVWEFWTEPEHIKKWKHASDDWHTTFALNELRPGGIFASRMEAKDRSMGFDFSGTYDEVKVHELISYTTGDGRKVKVTFHDQGNETEVIETFAHETENPIEFQQQGWQAILDNFKSYTEQTN